MKTHSLALTLLMAAGLRAAPCNEPRPPQTFYVSTAGNDAGAGTSPTTAFRKIQTGVNCLFVPGDRLLIFPGVYPELVTVGRKKGEPGKPIMIEGLSGIVPGPAVAIQGTITTLTNSQHSFQFHGGSPSAPNNEWIPYGNDGEYVSLHALPPQTSDWQVHQGAFVDPINGRHTRLITYDRVEDLRSANETFEKIVDGCPTQDPRPGPIVAVTSQGCTERRPWVYMGPGLWFNKTTNRIHIRLSPTHNGIPGLADYSGEGDPNKLALAVVDKNMTALKVDQSSHVQFKNLSVKFASVSVMVTDSTDIAFDQVAVWAGRYGVRAGRSARLAFSNCEFDGGLPTWLFRGDLKDQYKFLQNGALIDNFLGKQTMESLIAMEAVTDVDIHHSEFANAHDLYLQAANTTFHHNWIHNMHDDALFLDGAVAAGGLVHHNVIVQALSAISFAGDYLANPWRIYRNLVDLRLPTAGFRPRNAASSRSDVWRPGSAFKSGNTIEGPYDVFHNTFIVPFAAEYPLGQPVYPQASFAHLRNSLAPVQSRRSLNNAYVVLNHATNQEAPMAFLLPPGTPAEINGDLFYRRGYGAKLFATPIPGDPSHFHLFSCSPTENCMNKWQATPFFQSTGYEAQAVLLQDPQFNSWTGAPSSAEDFRLSSASPARNAGVPLPPELSVLDTETSAVASPDIGAYQALPGTGLAPKLRVGVRGRKLYPESGPGK